LKIRLTGNPAARINRDMAISLASGFIKRPETIPLQNGINNLRKGISLFSTVSSSYETIPYKDRNNIDLHELIHHGFH